MSPRIRPRPGARYRVRITEIADGDQLDIYDEEGDAYIAGVATLEGTRINALVDHNGPDLLRSQLLDYITESVDNPLQLPPR